MRIVTRKWRVAALASMAVVLSATATPVLENDAMRILFADASRGYGVTGIVNKVAGDVRFLRDTTREIDLWQVFFAKEKDGKRVECKEVSNRSPAKRRIERDGNRTTFVFEGIDLPDEPGAVDVRATVELEPGLGGSLWTLEVTNRSRVFGLTRTKYPVLKRVTDDGAGDVMMPSVNFGAYIQRKRDSKKIPDPRMVGYMGYSPMVSAFNLGDAGLYVAAHDGAGHDKYFDIKGEQNVSFYTPVENMGYVGRAGKGPGYPVCVACYKGDWWQAAKLYRKFALRQPWTAKGPICRRADYPKTMSETPLWINIHGDSVVATNTLATAKKVYPDFATGLHWHRWNLPGHDVNYPEYFPAVPGVSNAVAACRAMGQMPMIYTNGRLWDAGTMGWRFAQPYATVQDGGTPYIERYGNKRAQGVMCPYTREWQDVMNELARRITGPEIGAPGLFMDQIGAAAPKLCFNPAHGHALGGGTYWFEGYRKLLAQAHATTFANGAFLTTEGSAEPWMDNVDGYLIVTMRRAEDVPFYPAVYSGYTTYFCSPQHGLDDETSWRYLQTREALWGVELGWFSPSFLTAPGMAAKREIVGALCRLRMKYKNFLAYGTLLDEARFAAPPATVPICMRPRWVNRGKPQEFDAPAVIGNLWRNSADTETRLFLANISDTEQTVTLANDGFAGRTVTLSPHALEILSPK